MLKATVNGLQNLRRPEDVARMRGKTIAEVLPYKAPRAGRAEPEAPVAAAPEAAAEPTAEPAADTVVEETEPA